MSSAPMPFGDEITGICSRCANSVSSTRGLGQRDTVADEDDGLLRFENEIDARPRYFVGRGAAALRIERQ